MLIISLVILSSLLLILSIYLFLQKTSSDTKTKILEARYQDLSDAHSQYVIETESNNITINQQIKSATERAFKAEAQTDALQLAYNELLKSKEAMSEQFRLEASRIFSEGNKIANREQQEEINRILQPFKEKIEQLNKVIDQQRTEGFKQHYDLAMTIKNLAELNKSLGEEAAALTKALKGDNKAQGNWGEVVLERVLELAGLTKEQEFKIQDTLQSDDGTIYRPDVIVYLPEGKHIIIDSKVSLLAWDRFINSTDDTARTIALNEHIDSIKRHLKNLGEKSYSSKGSLNTPDFVILFMPIESAWITALQNAPTLFATAWEQKVVITGPATLLATLRTVSSVWKLQQQQQNAREIARQAGLLYDKLASFTDELQKIGESIDKSKSRWQTAWNALSIGRGNLLSRAERLKLLGVESRRQVKSTGTADDQDSDSDNASTLNE
ncbi:MAG: DNA recombination protein RmuC [Sphingobacteriia bacterium]|nr:DNA recombination protein RmuC [Sphingobacteriia bacterium]